MTPRNGLVIRRGVAFALIVACMLHSASYAEQEQEKTKPVASLWTRIQHSVAKLHHYFCLKSDEFAIVVYPSLQQLYLIKNQEIIKSYSVSTGKNGIGNKTGSEKTPPGTHRIKKKIGQGAPLGTIFEARRDTGEIATIYTDKTDLATDLITSRIMWLQGEEAGVNKGEGIDSHQRYIYIHGTPEEGLIGSTASHGCIRMKNKDVIELFDLVPEGTLIEIQAECQPTMENLQ